MIKKNLEYIKNQANEKYIIGRLDEKLKLSKIISSTDPEFFLLYGRRRIGKTFLIHNYCADKGVYFYFRAEENDELIVTINNFYNEIIDVFNQNGIILKKPKVSGWTDALNFLHENLLKLPKSEKIIILFDEFAWFNTQNSNFLNKISYFWNKQINNPENGHIKILCTGSATSFLINKVIKNKKGLFSRIKAHKLRPFSLTETSKFFSSRKITALNPKSIIESYLVFGGVPYYLKEITNDGLDVSINNSFFGENPSFILEYQDLFEGTFSNNELHKEIVNYIGFSKKGVSRTNIYKHLIKKFNSRYNGSQRKIALDDLVACDLVSETKLFSLDTRSKGTDEALYKVVDEFLLFYLYWINGNDMIKNKGYWTSVSKNRDKSSWAAEVFERVCLKHLDEIFKKMNISTNIAGYWWKDFSDPSSKEIDILVNRDDGIISIVEIKYYEHEYKMDFLKSSSVIKKEEYFKLFKERAPLTNHTKENKSKSTNIIFITANGMASDNKFYKDTPVASNFKVTDLL